MIGDRGNFSKHGAVLSRYGLTFAHQLWSECTPSWLRISHFRSCTLVEDNIILTGFGTIQRNKVWRNKDACESSVLLHRPGSWLQIWQLVQNATELYQ